MMWLISNLKTVLIVSAVAAGIGFLGGWKVNGTLWEGKLLAAQKSAEKQRAQLAAQSAKIVEDANKKEAQIVYRTKIVYKDIARIHGPAMCLDDERVQFVSHWNSSAGEAGGADAGLRGAAKASEEQ